MNADSRVVRLMQTHNTTFYPICFWDFSCRYSENRYLNLLLMEIAFITLRQGLSRNWFQLARFEIFLRGNKRSRRKRLIEMLKKLQTDEVINIEGDNWEADQLFLGLSPKTFGPLFPTYETALEILGYDGAEAKIIPFKLKEPD